MKEMHSDKKSNKKHNEAFLYDLGLEHIENICNETDALHEIYSDIEVPETLDTWFYDFNKKLEQKKRRKKLVTLSKKIGRNVAVFILIVFTVSSVLTLSVEAFRIRFLNLIIETNERYSLIRHEDTNIVNNSLPKDWTGYVPEYIPEGFELEEYDDTGLIKYLIYGNSNDKLIQIYQSKTTSVSQIDTEGALIMEVDINGNHGIMSSKDDYVIVTWNDGIFSLEVIGNIDVSELLKVAEKIK